ncbi:MAG: hypothetical protein HY259_14825 [Chloroflexi bacterium]|nr:hypothetical protein [Chloroflexota bacterium]MBI3734710.1 hypothetical protein [Chloroflexota bacterium]
MEAIKERTAKEQLIDKLAETASELPTEKVYELLDFAGYLDSHYSQRRPPRGSPEAILEALERVGPLIFEPGELERILKEIQDARELDLEEEDVELPS